MTSDPLPPAPGSDAGPEPAVDPASDAAPSIDAAVEFPSPPEDPRKLLAAVWRASSDADAPTLFQLAPARVTHVDVDPQSGYAAVSTKDDTHRALAVRPEFLGRLVAELTGRSVAEVTRLMAGGPVRIESAGRRRADDERDA